MATSLPRSCCCCEMGRHTQQLFKLLDMVSAPFWSKGYLCTKIEIEEKNYLYIKELRGEEILERKWGSRLRRFARNDGNWRGQSRADLFRPSIELAIEMGGFFPIRFAQGGGSLRMTEPKSCALLLERITYGAGGWWGSSETGDQTASNARTLPVSRCHWFSGCSTSMMKSW